MPKHDIEQHYCGRLYDMIQCIVIKVRWMDRNAFYVGSHQGLSVDDLDYMVNTIQDYYANH